MAVKVRNKKGYEVTLLNPSERGRKFADELRNNVSLTNDGRIKVHPDGEPMGLTSDQRSFRSGYLQAQKDSAKAWKSKQKKVRG